MQEPVLVINVGLRVDLVAAVESLPARYSQMLLLRDVQELTVGEMATKLQLSRQAVKGCLHRGSIAGSEIS